MKSRRTVLLLSLIVAVILLVCAFLRAAFWTYGADTGTMAIAIQNVPSGMFDPFERASHFHFHWSPILATLYPLLAERRREKAGVLSGGQRQILAIGRALLTEPKLILLDEPTAGLSPKAAAELFNLVRDVATEGAAVLMVEQNAKAALRMSDRGYVLAEGQNRIDGPAADLLANEEIGAIFLGARPGEAGEARP